MNKRKVCVVVYSRANYGRIKSFLTAVKNHELLELKIIVGASALLLKYGRVYDLILNDGFTIESVVYNVIEGDTPISMAKSTGLGILELSSEFERLKPDFVVTVADRFETLSTAVAASYMNIPLVHTQGGEITGSIDESVRHAITKLAHIHFPASEAAYRNVLSLGEDSKTVFLTGCPAIDLVYKNDLNLDAESMNYYKGVGYSIDFDKEYFVVLQHPVTTEFGNGNKQIIQTLDAVSKVLKHKDIQVVWLWPNIDAGSDHITKEIRIRREENKLEKVHFYKNFSPEDYLKIINNSRCLVGNSSSGIRESSLMGVPVVNIGTRQRGRERGRNVIDVKYNSDEIFDAIMYQLNHEKYLPEYIYGDGNAGYKMAEILSTIEYKIEKKLKFND